MKVNSNVEKIRERFKREGGRGMEKKRRALSESMERARKLLSQNGNRMTLVGGLLVWMSTLFFYRLFYIGLALLARLFYLDSGIWGLLFLLGYFCIAVLFTIMVSLPLLGGVLRAARSMAREEDVPLATIFEVFCSRRSYWRAVWLSDQLLGQTIGPVLVGALLSAFVASFFESNLIGFAVGGGVFLLFFALGLFVRSRGFWLFALAADRPQEPLRSLKRESKRMGRKRTLISIRFLMAFIPRILLGIVTLGIYLLAEALPLMMLTYFCEYEKTQELMKHLEEIDHE